MGISQDRENGEKGGPRDRYSKGKTGRKLMGLNLKKLGKD